MNREIYVSLRRTCIMMAIFAGSFILVYGGVVALTKFVYIYFRGFIPDFNENILRAVFYAISIASFIAFRILSRKRYSPVSLGSRLKDPDGLLRYLLMTPVIGMALAEAVLISAFFLFFLSAMYIDFIILALLSSVMIFMSIPGVQFLENKLNEAGKSR
ncbi:MAG: hypothetical protein HYV23_05185 [Deltaproteobacteria bacterium]|nr:hypothetical protein [Deltaproteobacteria bacterium]